MEPTRTLVIEVSGARSARTPATWGQRTIVKWLSIVTDGAHFTQGMVFGLAPGCGLTALRDAMAHVLNRYDALRTLFQTSEGTLWQVIEGDGELRVPVYSMSAQAGAVTLDDAWSAARVLSSELSAEPFANEKEWPVRMAVVEANGDPVILIFVSDRMTIDGHGVEVIIGDLLSTCAGEGHRPPPHWQPAEEAEFEQSPQGAAVSARAGQHWREVLTTAPATLFDFPQAPAEQPRFFFYEMESAAIKRALIGLKNRKRFGGSSVVLAAMAVVLSQYTGHDRISLRLVAGNRVGRDRKTMAGALVTEGAVLIDLAGLSFDEIAMSAFKASGRGNQFAFCDPDVVASVFDEQTLAKGAYLDLGACFSDIQGGFPGAPVADDAEADTDEPTLRRLALATTVKDSPGGSGVHGFRFFLSAVEAGNVMLLRLSADTTYFSRDRMRMMLDGIERLLIAVANAELGPAELAGATGIRPAPRDGWVRVGQGWVDLEATRALWAQVAGTDQATVLVEPSADGARLVGYLAADDEPDLRGLHLAFVAALAKRSDVRAPDWYRLTAGAADAAQDLAAWSSLPVLAQASGR